jgi:hypothetical protein
MDKVVTETALNMKEEGSSTEDLIGKSLASEIGPPDPMSRGPSADANVHHIRESTDIASQPNQDDQLMPKPKGNTGHKQLSISPDMERYHCHSWYPS